MSIGVYYKDANAAIEWLCKAFGFEVRLKVDGEGGVVEHSELVYEGAVIQVGDERRQAEKGRKFASPQTLNGQTMSACFYIDGVDEHCERARKAGATIAYEPTVSDYGEEYWSDKSYQAIDPEGHAWWFMQRLRGE